MLDSDFVLESVNDDDSADLMSTDLPTDGRPSMLPFKTHVQGID